MPFERIEDTVQHQKKFVKDLYYDPDKLSLAERKELTKDQLLGLSGEMAEFQEAIKLLPWKKNEIDYDNAYEELIDMYHHFLNLCILWNIETESRLKEIYFKKNELNYKRGSIHKNPTEGFKV